MKKRRRGRPISPYFVILMGAISASAASILFKFAAAEPLVVAFYRLAFSSVILAVPLLRHGWAPVKRRDLLLALLSGFFLAAHFALWFFSLNLTSIASSTVLVSTHPFLIILVAYFMWGERPERSAMIGLVVAAAGTTLIGWGDFALDARALWGDLLALLGAASIAGYLLIGRHLRQRVGALQYSAIAYVSASIALLSGAVVLGNPLTGFPEATWWTFLALAVFPTIFGHTFFNWALKHVPPSVVSVSILAEPVGATLLAWFIWRTGPGPLSLSGGGLLVLGIGVFQRAVARTY